VKSKENRTYSCEEELTVEESDPTRDTGASPARAMHRPDPRLTSLIGWAPYRLALAGGWIDQPFVSKHNPEPPGSMVVVSLLPDVRYMERAGMATGTRKVLLQIWPSRFPEGDPMDLVRALYAAENEGRADPSGSQDMIGLIYPGVTRLDYDIAVEGGVFPCHMERLTDPSVGRWLEEHIRLVPVGERRYGYDPLEEKRITPDLVARLGRSGKDCFEAIRGMDAPALGRSLTECMAIWREMLPNTVVHRTVDYDLAGLLDYYAQAYHGAMISGAGGGGYVIVVTDEEVPGSLRVSVRMQ